MAPLLRELQLSLPVELAFARLADPARMPEWMEGLVGLSWGRLPPEQAGRSFVIARRFGGQTLRHPAEVLVYDPPRTYAWRVLQDQVDLVRRLDFAPEPGGTKLRISVELRPVTPLIRLALPWLRHQEGKGLDAELERLRGFVAEGSSAR